MSSGIFNQYSGNHNRRSIRLCGYDYSHSGYYFLTICIHDHTQWLFGDVENGEMVENKYGAIVREEWNQTAIVRPYMLLDTFSIMPNHVHGIIRLTDCRGTARRAPTIEQFGKPTIGTIPTIVRALKSAVSKRIHLLNQTFKWQRNYYEHVIRDEKSLFLIRKYILENPIHWSDDTKNHITREIRQLDMGEILY